MPRFVILRPFKGDTSYGYGDVADLRGANLKLLEDQGYIERVEPGTPLMVNGVEQPEPAAGKAPKAKPGAKAD